MVTIIFESHATTFDNEQQSASGHYDVALSPRGIEQAKDMGRRYQDNHFAAIFCSDLQRSYRTAELAFAGRSPIFKDDRLRECDYGEREHAHKGTVEVERPKHEKVPFPGGESYEYRTDLMRSFCEELLRDYDGKIVLVIGHRATQYGLERWTAHKPLSEILAAPWQWQPGWTYKLSSS